MESKIITLSADIVSKIAAGEVIERPASCIKELIENAIDAEATNILCKIQGNGTQEIEVIDDGIGMNTDELELALQPHTTSKLKTEEDLFRITNFGFRGEALYSILSVAELEITSKTSSDEHGTYIKATKNTILEKMPSPRTKGTTIRIRNLFYTLPARRKFLKPAKTELRYISNTVQHYALAYPETAFSLMHDDRKIMELFPSTLAYRISTLFGEDLLNSLQKIDYSASNIRIFGYLSKPYNLGLNSVVQIFINKRPCRDRVIKKAIENAYGTVFHDKKPSCIIFIEVPPDFIDVNVHPRKEEVRFKNESYVYGFVLNAVREQLGINFEKSHFKMDSEFKLEGTSFWQLHDTYIFAETESGFLVIDQHAAHERIVYEQVMRESGKSQHLLFPILVEITEFERKYFNEYSKELQSLGFDIELFGEKTLRIRSIPITMKEVTPGLFKSILVELEEYGSVEKDKLSEVAKLIACKSSVTAESKLCNEEMNALIKRLLVCKNPYFCPHGRPTILQITKEELARKFGRTSF